MTSTPENTPSSVTNTLKTYLDALNHPPWCHRCDHPAHGEKDHCGYFSNGSPLFSSWACACTQSIELSGIKLDLLVLKRGLAWANSAALQRVADALGVKIPDFPILADIHIHDGKRP